MITPALISYIEQSLKAGKKKDQIKSELMLAGGWQESEIETAFATLKTSPYTKSFGSKISSFFLTLLIVIIIIGGLAFAAIKFLGPTANQIGGNIIAALPWNKPAPAVPAPMPQPIVTTQSAAVPATVMGGVSSTSSTTSSQSASGLAAGNGNIHAGNNSAQTTPNATAQTTTPTPVKCAYNDSSCLMQAVSSCSPTSTTVVTTASSTDLPQIPFKKEYSTRTYTIVGPQNNQCTMKFSVKGDTNVKFAYKSASCSLSNSDLSTLLNNWTTGDFYTDTGIDLYGKCSGSYFNN